MALGREYTDEELDALLGDLDEVDIVKKLTKEEEAAVVLMHADYDVSITALCRLLNISRDKYYYILKKAGKTSATVDYIKLATHEEW